MADIQSNIRVNVDTSDALANIKALQRQISAFQSAMSRGGAASNAQAASMRQNLINTLNASGQFAASIQRISSTTESFTNALEKNKLSMGEYFRYAGGASKSFGRLFKSEMDTIEKVAISRVKSLQTQYIQLGRDANGAMKAIAVRPLTLDMENLATKTAIAAQKQQLLNQLLKQGSTNLLNFGKNTQWAGRQLMVGFTIPLTMLGSVATKTFQQMEEQAIKFKRVYGDSFTATAETDAMLKQVKELSAEFTKYGIAVEKTMELAATAAASGKMGADLLAQVSSATKLAVLGNVDQQKALDTTISLTNAFGTATEELANKINFLNAVENQTVTSIDDLTEAIPKAAPVIKQLGGDVEDLAFFLTAMREGGVNASEGANALKSGLASLINPTAKASKMLEGFGINIQSIVQRNKNDVKGLVIDFSEALNKLDPLKRAQAIEQLFGKFQFSRLSTLFQNVTKEGTQASRVLELTKQTSAELAMLSRKELKSIESSPMFKFQKAIADFKNELAPVGEEFIKAVTPLINFGTDLLKSFNKLEPSFKQFIVNITGLVAGVGPVLLMTFGLIANGVANLIKGFAFIKNVFNRASSASTVLGETTHYMTTEQLRAAAVAASLEQAHNKLAQAFTVEKGALDLLTASYQKATAAQQGFRVPGGMGKTTPKKKYASGVVSVPGPKGAGDIVPAMLAPGEAVIPAKMASKYSGFIRGMISGNIPGFEDGKFDARQRVRAAPGIIIKQVRKIFEKGWLGREQEMEAMRKVVFREADAKGLTGRKRLNFLSNYGFGKSGPVDSTHIASMGDDKYFTSKNVIPEHRALNQVFANAVEKRVYKDGTSIVSRMLKDPAKIQEMVAASGLSEKELVKELKMMDPVRPGGAQYPTTEKGLRALQAFYGSTDQNAGTRIASAGLKERLKVGTKAGGFIAESKPGGKIRLDPKLDAQAIAQQDMRIKKSQTEAVEKRKVNTAAVAENTTVTKKETKTKKAAVKMTKKEILERAKMKKAEGKRLSSVEKLTLEQDLERKRIANERRKATIAANKVSVQENSQAREATNMRLYGQKEDPSREQVLAARDARKQKRLDAKAAARQKRLSRMSVPGSQKPKTNKGLSAKGIIAGTAAAAVLSGGDLQSMMLQIAAYSLIQKLFTKGGAKEIGQSIGNTFKSFGTLKSVVPKLAGVFTRFGGIVGLVIGGLGALYGVVSNGIAAKKKELDATVALGQAGILTKKKMDVLGEVLGQEGKTLKKGELRVVNENSNQMSTESILRKDEGFLKEFKTTIEALRKASKDDSASILNNLAIQMIGAGWSKQYVLAVVSALQKEARNTSFTLEFKDIDITTAKGRQTIADTARKGVAKITKDYEDNLRKTGERLAPGVDPSVALQGTSDYVPIMGAMNDKLTAEVKKNALSLKATMEGLALQLQSGVISTEDYQKAINGLIGEFSDLSDPKYALAAEQLVNTLGYGLSGELRASIAGVGNLNQQMRILAMINAGLNMDKGFLDSLASANASGVIRQVENAQGKLDKIWQDFVDKFFGKNETTEKTSLEIKLEAIGKVVSKLQTGLDIIGLKEDAINKVYDSRLDALDKIQQANDAISQQQQDQLDLADAITRGDIAGAARAMQQARSNAADRAVQQQRDAIETARNNELSKVTDPLGRNRTKLEALIDAETMKKLLLEFGNGKAGGGHIRGRGTGTSDDIPAMLSNGEYVIRAKAVKALGVDTLDRMNHAEKFMKGGPVNLAKYAKGGPVNIAKYANGGFADPNDIVGRGLNTVMNGIFESLFGGFGKNLRQGNLTAPTGDDLGTIAMNALPIPGLKGAKGVGKLFGAGSKVTKSGSVVSKIKSKASSVRLSALEKLSEKIVDDPTVSITSSNVMDAYRVLKDPTVFTRRNLPIVMKMLEENQAKSLFQTNTSGGSVSKVLRSAAETEMFGAENIGNIIYGYLADPKLLASKNTQNFLHPFSVGTRHYGDVVLELKKNLLERTSVTAGDSLNNFMLSGQKNVPLLTKSLTEPSSVRMSAFSKYVEEQKSLYGKEPFLPYLEAQMPRYSPRSDIARMHVGSKQDKKALEKFMKQIGLDIPVSLFKNKPSTFEQIQSVAAEKMFNLIKYGSFKRPGYANGGLVNPIDVVGRGMSTVMDSIYQSLFGGWFNNVRKGKPTAPTGEDLGTMAMNVLPIPGLKPIKAAAKSMKASSPIIRGIFGKTGSSAGISSAGTTSIGGVPYFLKKLGSAKQQDKMLKGLSSLETYPEGLASTGLQEYFIANTLRKLGINTPDLKLFGDMSSIENGLVLGSKALPNMQSMDTYSSVMSRLRGDQEQADLFMRMMDTGVSNFAQREAVVNALLGNTDTHFGNVLFNTKTGGMSILDFARLSDSPRVFETMKMSASMSAKSLQDKIQIDSALKRNTQMDLIGKTGIPHALEEIEYGLPGAKMLRLGQRSADMKPAARDLANALGFDLSLATLPKDFAKNNPVLQSAISALKTTQIEKPLMKKISAESQQKMLESIFKNIKTVLSQKDATFKYANGGMVKPKYFAKGGLVGMYANGGDVVPSMLTPGEFVVSQPAVKNFGVDNLKAINNGTHSNDSVYNYSVNLNVNGSNANADDIARAVSRQINRINSQRIRGTRV